MSAGQAKGPSRSKTITCGDVAHKFMGYQTDRAELEGGVYYVYDAEDRLYLPIRVDSVYLCRVMSAAKDIIVEKDSVNKDKVVLQALRKKFVGSLTPYLEDTYWIVIKSEANVIRQQKVELRELRSELENERQESESLRQQLAGRDEIIQSLKEKATGDASAGCVAPAFFLALAIFVALLSLPRIIGIDMP